MTPKESAAPEAPPAAALPRPLGRWLAGLSGRRSWLWLVAAALAGTALTFTRQPWLLPLGQSLLVWPVLLADLQKGRLGDAVRHMLCWAVVVSLTTVEITLHYPALAEAAIWRSAAYREEMFTFIRTGIGPEGSPALYLPLHVRDYVGTLLLSLVSAGLAGLALGAVLLNYMNYYVGALVLEGSHPLLGSLFGWPIWAAIRVVGFVIGAIVAAHLGWGRILRLGPWRPGAARKLILYSLAFFLADLILKALLAPYWRKILLRALEP